MEKVVDLKGIGSADEFYARLSEVITLPEYFGYNLDALSDVLTEQRELRLLLTNVADAEALMPKFVRTLRRMAGRLHAEEGGIELILAEGDADA